MSSQLPPPDRYRNSAPFLIHYSTKSDTDSDDASDKNSIVDPNLNSNAQDPAKNTSAHTLYSSNSSFSRDLVLYLGHKNTWDSVKIESPVVRRFLGDEEERWYMWYHGRSGEIPGSDSIGLAVSSNGIHWEKGEGSVQLSVDMGLVLNCSNDWWAFDKGQSKQCCLLAFTIRKVLGLVKLGKIIGGGNGSFNEYGAVNARVVRNRKDGNYVMAYEGVTADRKRSNLT